MTDSHREPAAQQPPQKLKRVLNMWDAAALIVGIIIGSGIFAVPPSIARDLDSFLPLIGVWVAGGVLALAGALTYAELSTMFPRTGGPYVFLHETYGPFPAFAYGWSAILITYPASMAAVAVFFAITLSHWVPMSSAGQSAVASGLCIVVALLNTLGVKLGARVQRALTAAKVLAISAIPIFGFLLMKGDVANFTPVAAAPSGGWSLTAMALAMAAVMWTFEGWADAPTLAGEVTDLKRDIPRALILGTVGVMVIYVAVNAAYVYLLGIEGIAASEGVAPDAAAAVFGPAGAIGVTALILVSTASSLNAMTISGSRVVFAMSQDGLFLKSAGSVHRRFETPAVALIVLGVIGAIYAALGTFEQIIRYFVFVAMIWFSLNILAVFILRRKRPNADRPFRVPLYPVTPAIFLGSALGLMIQLYRDNTRDAIVGLILIALSIPIYLIWKRFSRSR